jgi:hypothetical protein
MPRDAGAVQLARRYAGLIDAAASAVKYRKPLETLERAVRLSDDPDAPEALEKLRDALAAHSVASDLGPKLLAVLTSLGMTLAGRSAKGGAQGGPAIGGKLDELRARRQRRARAD